MSNLVEQSAVGIYASGKVYCNECGSESLFEKKQVDKATQIFQENQPINLDLISCKVCSEVDALKNVSIIDPREEMIGNLEKQNHLLLNKMARAAEVFEENQAAKNQTIASLAKSNEELATALIQAEKRNTELNLFLEAQSKVHKEDIERRTKILTEEAKRIVDLCNSIELCQEKLPFVLDILLADYFQSFAFECGMDSVNLSIPRLSGHSNIVLEDAKLKLDADYLERIKGWKLIGKHFPEVFIEEAITKLQSIKNRAQLIQTESEK